MKPGDMVSTIPRWAVMHGLDLGRKAYASYPGEYGYHKAVIVYSEDVGVILEIREEFTRILVHGQPLWIANVAIECKPSPNYDKVLP